VALAIVVGVASRQGGGRWPRVIGEDLGDGLWGMMFYLLVVLVRPRASRVAAAVVALALATGTEVLKLYHAPWIDALRGRPVTGFLLGHEFAWRNVVAYGVGVAVAVAMDGLLRRRVGR
jgi:hypothetical protein